MHIYNLQDFLSPREIRMTVSIKLRLWRHLKHDSSVSSRPKIGIFAATKTSKMGPTSTVDSEKTIYLSP